MPASFKGRSVALSGAGLAASASNLGVKAQEIWAVLSVETSGCGFFADGRPAILYERHVFHRLTGGRFDDGDISSASPGGYGPSGAHQYDRLNRAIQLDRNAALKSASWGIGQIMGENFASVGFADVETMVSAMGDSEDAQLNSVARFLIAHQLAGALQSHDWASFARGYNGPNFAINSYDVRLRGEFARFSTGQMPDLDVRAAQLYLRIAGLSPGPVDGFFGKQTQSALSMFQERQGLPVTGRLDVVVMDRLVQMATGGAAAATAGS